MRTIMIALVSLISVAGMSVSAQTSVSGSVANKSGEALVGSTVLFLQADTVAGGTITDGKGRFELKGLPKGDYVCEVSMLGYKPESKKFTLTEKAKLPKFELEEDATMLGEVTVTGDARKMTKELAGMSIYYLTDRAKNELDAFKALKEIPRLIVDDANKTIKLDNGTSPLILVNGVKKPLSVLDPKMIESVEVIDNPSARYRGDASVASVLNVKIKRTGVKPYIRTSISGNTSFDTKNLNANGDFSMGDATSSLYLTGSYTDIRGRRSSGHSDIFQGDLHQELNDHSKIYWRNPNIRFGGDKEFSKKNYVAFSFMYMSNPSGGKTNTEGTITNMASGAVSPLTSYFDYKGRWHQLAANLYYKLTFKENRTLEITGNYSNSGSGSTADREQTNDFFSYVSNIDLDNNRQMGKLEANYSDMLTSSMHLDAGSNTEYSVTNIDDKLDEWPNFRYRRTREYLYAGIDNNMAESKFNYMVSLGLDMVFSDAAGAKNSYVDFVPSVSLAYKITQSNSLMLNYERRRTMPNAGNLNPRNTSTDKLEVVEGNPYLKPSHSDMVKFDYVFSNGSVRINPYIQYTYNSDQVMPYGYLDGDIYVNTYQNMGSSGSLQTGAMLSYNIPYKNGFYGNVSFSAYYQKDYIKDLPFSGDSFNITLNGYVGYKKISASAYVGLFPNTFSTYSKAQGVIYSNAGVDWRVSKRVSVGISAENYLFPKRHTKVWVRNGDYRSFSSSVQRNQIPKVTLGVQYTFVTKNFKWRNSKQFYESDNELQSVTTK